MVSGVDIRMEVSLVHLRVRHNCSFGAWAVPSKRASVALTILTGLAIPTTSSLVAGTPAESKAEKPGLTIPTVSPPVLRTPAASKARKQSFKHRKMMKYSGALLNEFELSMIKKPTNLVDITDFDFVASYNWRNSDEPVIFVPGKPPLIDGGNFRNQANPIL